MSKEKQFLVVIGVVLVYLLALFANQVAFSHTEVVNGVNWVYVPTGVRMLAVLLFGGVGAVGLLIAGLLVDFFYYFPNDPVRAIAGAVIGAGAPYLVYHFIQLPQRLRLATPVTSISFEQVFALAGLVAVANAGLHYLYFLGTGHTVGINENFEAMAIGDFIGSIIVLIAAKFYLQFTVKSTAA